MSQLDGKQILGDAPFGLVVREGDVLHPLTHRGAYLLLSRDGLHIGAKRFTQKSRYVPYEDITHIVPARRGIWLGTRRTLETISRGRRTRFDSAAVAREIEARIAQRPGGAEQLSLMRDNDRRQRNGHARWVTSAFVLCWILVHALQFRDGYVSEVGLFARELVAQGEWWRVMTSQFLHQWGLWNLIGPVGDFLPLHIAVNASLALLLGHLVEQPLGARRTLIILGAAGVCAAAASGAANEQMVGGSGFVLGLAGAALALELSMPERLPAPWRLPRTLFVVALVAEAAVGFGTSFIAGWAHLGGFAGGYLAARAVAGGAIHGRAATPLLRFSAAAVVAGLLASFVAVTPLALRLPYAMNEHAEHLLELTDVDAGVLNNFAWRIATESAALPDRGDRALALAERAVDQTGRNNPDYLDTLAEIQFLSGDALAAIDTIDEALEIAPRDDYFLEQRNRFIGLRDADDRPPSPSGPWYERGPFELELWHDDEGIAI